MSFCGELFYMRIESEAVPFPSSPANERFSDDLRAPWLSLAGFNAAGILQRVHSRIKMSHSCLRYNHRETYGFSPSLYLQKNTASEVSLPRLHERLRRILTRLCFIAIVNLVQLLRLSWTCMTTLMLLGARYNCTRRRFSCQYDFFEECYDSLIHVVHLTATKRPRWSRMNGTRSDPRATGT